MTGLILFYFVFTIFFHVMPISKSFALIYLLYFILVAFFLHDAFQFFSPLTFSQSFELLFIYIICSS